MVNGWPAWHACVSSSVALSYTECAVAMSASVSLGKSSLTWEAGVQLYYVLYVLYFIVYYIILLEWRERKNGDDASQRSTRELGN